MKPPCVRANKHLIKCPISLAVKDTQNIKELQYLHLYTHKMIHILQGQLGSSTEILSMRTLCVTILFLQIKSNLHIHSMCDIHQHKKVRTRMLQALFIIAKK